MLSGNGTSRVHRSADARIAVQIANVKTLDEVMRDHVWDALRAAGNNKTVAAEALGITRWTLQRLMRRWGWMKPSVKRVLSEGR